MIPTTPSITEFFNRFPSLKLAAENFPISPKTFEDVGAFLAWASSARLSEAQQHAAFLVATVMNDFRALPEGKHFDFAIAISHWDKEHWKAFREWISDSLK